MCGYDLLAGVWLHWQIPLLTWEASPEPEPESASEGIVSAHIVDFERLDHNAIRLVIRSARWEPPRLSIEVAYQVEDRVWTHSWGAWEISGRELADNLGSAGLWSGHWLTDDHAWFTAEAP